MTNARMLLLAPLLIGCADERRSAGTTVVDTLSSGTIVVRNVAPPERWSADWRLELIARVPADGADSVVFGRVHDVAISQRNEVHVLDGQASEVLVFGMDGQLVRRFGRRGSGPGDLNGPYALTFDASGRPWVAEERANRYSVFTPAGEFIESHPRPMRYSFTRGVLRFSSDGDLHELSTVGTRAAYRISVGDSISVRQTLPLPAFSVTAFRKTVGTEQFLGVVPFTPRQVQTVGPSGELWVSSGDEYRLMHIGQAGDTVRVIEKETAAISLSPEERAEANAEADRYSAEGYDVDRGLIPEAHPALSAVVVADDGFIWVERLADVGAGNAGKRTLVYDVYDPTGVLVAMLPARVASSPAPHITANHLAGVVLGPDDEARIEIYRIVRP